jgi:hypothetical protein
MAHGKGSGALVNRCVYARKKPQLVAQGSFFDSIFSGRQAFPARTSQKAAPTL